jgi:hypothetical protein
MFFKESYQVMELPLSSLFDHLNGKTRFKMGSRGVFIESWTRCCSDQMDLRYVWMWTIHKPITIKDEIYRVDTNYHGHQKELNNNISKPHEPCVKYKWKEKTRCASQIYRLHGFVPIPCKICYFIGLYYLNTNVMHFLNTKVMHMIFLCKQNK